MELWQTILLSLAGAIGGTSAMVAVLGWLAKSIITSRLQRQLESHKTELEFQNQISLERYKADIERLQREHEIRFNKLHEKRGDIIAETHGILVDMEEQARELEGAGNDAGQWKEHVTALAKISIQYSRHVSRNSLYFDEKLVEKLNELAHLIMFSAILYEKNSKNVTEESMAPYSKMRSSLSEVKKLVETEFRKLLGVHPIG